MPNVCLYTYTHTLVTFAQVVSQLNADKGSVSRYLVAVLACYVMQSSQQMCWCAHCSILLLLSLCCCDIVLCAQELSVHWSIVSTGALSDVGHTDDKLYDTAGSTCSRRSILLVQAVVKLLCRTCGQLYLKVDFQTLQKS